MMMISSARLTKMQRGIQNLRPYEQGLRRILHQLTDTDQDNDTENRSPFLEERPARRVAIVAFASNTGLAGRFNDNIGDFLKKQLDEYRPLGNENIFIYPIGDKIAKVTQSLGFKPQGNFTDISEHPSYEHTTAIADELMDQFRKKEIDRVELIYHHFRNKGSQVLTHETYLPIRFNPTGSDLETSSNHPGTKKDSLNDDNVGTDNNSMGIRPKRQINYIIEPDRKTIVTELIPEILRLKLYSTHLDSVTSEHAARVTAMRVASDNADDLTRELTLEYNKLRQQSITNELLDLVGGAFDSQ